MRCLEAENYFFKGYYKAVEDTRGNEKIYLGDVVAFCSKSYKEINKEIEDNKDDYYNSGYAYGVLFVQNNKAKN